MPLPSGLGFLGAREQGETQEQFLQRVRKRDRAGLGIVAGGTIHGISDPEEVYKLYGEDFLKTLGPVEATGRGGGDMPLAQLLTFGKSAPGAFDTNFSGKPAPAPATQTPLAIAPGEYEATVKRYTDTGISLADAEKRVSELFAGRPGAAEVKKATVFHPTTGQRKVVTVGDPNAFAGGFVLETPTDSYAIRKTKGTAGVGAPTGTGAPIGAAGGGQPDINAMAAAAADEANRTAKDIAAEIGNKDVSVRGSAKILKDVEKKLETPAPAALTRMEELAKQKAALGIDPLESEMAGIDSDIESIKTNLLVEAEKAGERLVSMSEISRSRGKLQKEAEQKIALLNVRRSAIARQLGYKIDTLKTIMTLTGQDYDNAQAKYDKEFQRSIQLLNIVRNVEQDEKTNLDRQADNARANLTVIRSSLADGGLSWTELNDSQKLMIEKMELQAYGTTGIMAQLDPTEKELDTFTRSDGNRVSVFYNPLTKQTREIILGRAKAEGGGVGGIGGGQIGNIRVSDSTLNVLEGVQNLGNLTAGEKTKVIIDLRKLGFYSETPPSWFREQAEQQMKQSLTPEVLKELWEKNRQSVIKEEKKGEGNNGSSSDLTDEEFMEFLKTGKLPESK